MFVDFYKHTGMTPSCFSKMPCVKLSLQPRATS
jgi:hypothetical protein